MIRKVIFQFKKKRIYDLLHFNYFFLLIIMNSCDRNQPKIEDISNQIEVAAAGIEEMTDDDWNQLAEAIDELEEFLHSNRRDLTEEQISEINRIKGKFAALLIKKEIYDLENTFLDFKDQMEGFVDEISIDTAGN